MARKPPSTPPKTVLEFYAVGKWLKEQGSSDPEQYSRDIIVDMAERMGKSPSYVNKWRLFARLYNEQELAVLLALRWPNGRSLGMGHVCQLLEINTKSLREKLQCQAAEGGWTVQKLQAERFKLQGKSSRARLGGRPPKVQMDAQELKTELAQRADQWCRWFKASADVLKEVRPKGRIFGPSKCSTRILRLAGKVDEQMRALAAALNTHD